MSNAAAKRISQPRRAESLALPQRTSLIDPAADFWLLGGASILMFVVFQLAEQFRLLSEPVGMRLAQVPATFLMLNFLCNYPHFLISYKFAYSRGTQFLTQHWIRLLVIPAVLVATVTIGFLGYADNFNTSGFVTSANSVFESLGLGLRLGRFPLFGMETMSALVWLMYSTVGWHYSKQIFGCVMVYSKYSQYPISARQRLILKCSLFSAAFYQFVNLSAAVDRNAAAGKPTYSNVFVTPLGLPEWLQVVATSAVVIGLLAVIGAVFIANYRSHQKVPNPTLLVSWFSIFVWWVSPIEQFEFITYAVPFFHSLQYLPFAYKMEAQNIPSAKSFSWTMSFRLLMLVTAGFLAFELIPSVLDIALETKTLQTAWYFTLAAGILINIHHFFIDSVVWKFNQPQVQKSLFS